MDFDSEFPYFAIALAIPLVILIYLIATKGVKSLMFGGTITRTYGEVELTKIYPLIGRRIKIHKVTAGPKAYIGFELLFKSPLSYDMKPVALSKEEAQRLVQLLTLAINET